MVLIDPTIEKDKHIKRVSLICVLALFLALTGCSTENAAHNTETPLLSLRVESIKYLAGTTSYLFDFDRNVVKRGFSEGHGTDNIKYEQIASFSDEKETALYEKLDSYGFFDLDEDYPAPSGIFDGGGWKVVIEYRDGTTKQSKGSNNSPEIFSECAKAFYDICEDGIIAYVPEEYYIPPHLSFDFRSGSTYIGFNAYAKLCDYRWNGFGSANNDIYKVNVSAVFNQKFYEDKEYVLSLGTADYYKYPKFQKCTVTSFDYSRKLTGQNTVYSGGWFSHIEIELDMNKIYLIRLDFDSGDFAEYTFNTKTVK